LVSVTDLMRMESKQKRIYEKAYRRQRLNLATAAKR